MEGMQNINCSQICCSPRCKITSCLVPLLNIEKKKGCQAYFPKIEPIKSVRFIQPSNNMQGCGPWTNLTYHHIIQGGLKYYGVEKLVPYGFPPSSPVLCRPLPLKPTDSPGMIVYSAP